MKKRLLLITLLSFSICGLMSMSPNDADSYDLLLEKENALSEEAKLIRFYSSNGFFLEACRLIKLEVEDIDWICEDDLMVILETLTFLITDKDFKQAKDLAFNVVSKIYDNYYYFSDLNGSLYQLLFTLVSLNIEKTYSIALDMIKKEVSNLDGFRDILSMLIEKNYKPTYDFLLSCLYDFDQRETLFFNSLIAKYYAINGRRSLVRTDYSSGLQI